MCKEHEMKQVEKAFESLPENIQQAVLWLIGHMDFARQMCKSKAFTEEEMRWMLNYAKEKSDNLLLVLLMYKQFFDEKANKGYAK